MEYKFNTPFDYNKEFQRLVEMGYKKDYVPELMEILMKKHGIQNSEDSEP
jgi:hypothetical protein